VELYFHAPNTSPWSVGLAHRKFHLYLDHIYLRHEPRNWMCSWGRVKWLYVYLYPVLASMHLVTGCLFGWSWFEWKRLLSFV